MKTPADGRIECRIPVIRTVVRFTAFDSIEIHPPHIAVFRRYFIEFPEVIEGYCNLDNPVFVVGPDFFTVSVHINFTLYVFEIPLEPSLNFAIQTLSRIYDKEVDFRIDRIYFVLIVIMAVTVWVDEQLDNLFFLQFIILFGVVRPGIRVFTVETDIEVRIIPEAFYRGFQGYSFPIPGIHEGDFPCIVP